MFYSNHRPETRHIFFHSWQKQANRLPLEPLERLIVEVIYGHPEYHSFFDHPEKNLDKDYHAALGNPNPFLHLGLHLALREQISINRPVGIQTIYENLLKQYHDAHEVEHLMMACLEHHLWLAQQNHQAPDETAYYKDLSQLGLFQR